MKRQASKDGDTQGLLNQCVKPDAAGIDLGARQHYVALPQDRAEQVRSFGCYTADLDEMAQWLHAHGIKSVAMEATGVYWIPVYQKLEAAAFEVVLVNSKHLKIVPGRKTDVQDCQWIQLLHQCGLLKGSYRPPDAHCVMRTYMRQRDNLTAEASSHILRMHKALEQMNIQLHKVVGRLAGKTGLAIARSIVDGQRDPRELAKLRNHRCKRAPEEFIKALQGDWREEHLFCLAQELAAYDLIQTQIAACDAKIAQSMEALPTRGDPADLPESRIKRQKRRTQEERAALFRVVGQDLTAAEGLGWETVRKLVAEVGVDPTPWPTAKHFASWATLAPGNNVTGGKRRRSKGKANHRVGQIFKVAAQGLANAKSALGAYYRRIRARRGAAVANKAAAHKMALRFYYILRYGANYVAQDADYYEKQYAHRLKSAALKTLGRLGFEIELKEKHELTA